MPRADFYLIDKPRFRADPLLLVCELARKAYDAKLPTLILVRDAEQAEAVDYKLWEFDADAFIPHQIAGDEDDDITPVLIVPPGASVPARAMIINLREECAGDVPDSVKEVVAADPAERDGSRRRWQEYKARGFEVRKFDM
jgi:DNA polymerase-3 subunit chi